MRSAMIFLLLAFFLSPAPVLAQQFDCVGFLKESGVSADAAKEVFLLPPLGARIPPVPDVVNIEEQEGGQRGLVGSDRVLLLDAEQGMAPQVLDCRVLRVSFVLSKGERAGQFMMLSKRGALGDGTDVLVVQVSLAPQDDPDALNSRQLDIPILLHGARAAEAGLPLGHDAFFTLKTTGEADAAGQVVPLDKLNDNVRPALPRDAWPGEGGFSSIALTLCEPMACQALAEAIGPRFWMAEHVRNPPVEPVARSDGSAEPDSAAPSEVAPPWTGSGATEEPAGTAAPDAGPAAGAPQESTDTPGDPGPVDQPSGGSLPRPEGEVTESIEAPPPELLVLRDQRDPQRPVSTSVATTEDLICLLAALEPGYFDPAPAPCRESAFSALRLGDSEETRLWVAPDGALEILPTVRVAVTRLEVTLPPGQDGVACVLRARYAPASGGDNVEVRLSRSADRGDQTVFAARLPEAPAGHRSFVLDLVPDDAADCGASGRSVEVEMSGETAEVALFSGSNASVEVVYVSLFNDTAHRLTPSQRATLANAMFEAIRSAHNRASHFLANRPWPISDVTVGAITSSGGEVLARASGTELRQNGDQWLSAVRRDRIETLLSRERVALTPDALAKGLRGLVRRREGTGRVVAVIIGPAAAPTVIGDYDICRAPDFEEARKLLTGRGRGPALDLIIVPLVAVSDIALLPHSELEPVDFTPGLPQLAGAMFNCRTAPEGIAVYAFLAEDWRYPDEVAQRFGVSAADRLGALLNDLITSYPR